MSNLIVERTETEVELIAVVNKNSGPVTGATVVVAIRDGETANSWLDFADGVFKTSGWTTRQASVAEVSSSLAPGIYRRELDLTAITLPSASDHLVAEYSVTSPVNFPTDVDYIELVTSLKTLATAAALATVQADTDDIQARLPATLVGGRMRSHVEALDAGVITSTVAPNLDATITSRASQTSVDTIQNVTRVAISIPRMLIPDSGGPTLFKIHLNLFDTAGNPEDPDGPDIIDVTAENQSGASRTANLGGSPVGRMTKLGVGRYEITYSVSTAHAIEELIFHFTYLENTISFTQDRTTEAVATLEDNFTAADRATLSSVDSRLPASLSSGKMRSQVEGMDASVVTAAAIATDAIDADALAASAVAEVQSGLATAAAVAGVQADTDDIQSRLPAALVTGRMDAHVGSAAAGVITSTVAPNLDVAVSSRAAPGAAMTLTTAERDAVANALLDLASGVETPHTVRQALRIVLAAVAAKTSGGPATQVFRNLADTANRLTTISDGSGNRTSATATP